MDNNENKKILTAEFASEIEANKAMLDDTSEGDCPVHSTELTDGFCEFCQVCYSCK